MSPLDISIEMSASTSKLRQCGLVVSRNGKIVHATDFAQSEHLERSFWIIAIAVRMCEMGSLFSGGSSLRVNKYLQSKRESGDGVTFSL